MTRQDTDYRSDALSDARDTLGNFIDEIAEQSRDGDVSNDLFNDYSGGDSWHHEQHVDRDYSLSESAALLDALSEFEEDDSGLWQGLEPRLAIAAQAAYTYGNAVMSFWHSFIDDINGLLSGEEGENRREGLARLFVLLVSRFSADDPEHNKQGTFARHAYDSLLRGDLPGVGMFADWLEERKICCEDIRAALAMAEKADDDDDSEGDDD